MAPVQVNEHVRVSVSDSHEDDFIRDQVTVRFDIKLPKRIFIEASSVQDAIGPLLDAVNDAAQQAWDITAGQRG